MKYPRERLRYFYAAWTAIAATSAVPIFFDTLGTAAWNGVNFAMAIYLFVSAAGLLAILAGFCAAFSGKALFHWVSFIGSVSIALLSLTFAASFILSRTPGVPLNDWYEIFGIKAPILAFYATAFGCCSVQALVQFSNGRTRKILKPNC